MVNEKKEADEREDEGDEQDITEIQFIGLGYWNVLVLHKETKNSSCENSETQSCASQSLSRGSS